MMRKRMLSALWYVFVFAATWVIVTGAVYWAHTNGYDVPSLPRWIWGG